MSNYCPTCGNSNSPYTQVCSHCNTNLSGISLKGILSPSTILKDRYMINELIKIGGMGAVYIGEDVYNCKKIAIKELFIASPGEKDNFFIKRFEREAKLLSQLLHPNLPRVSDFFHDCDNYFMIMDYINGPDLECMLKKCGNPGLPEEDVVEWGIQLCSVLNYLHSRVPPIIYRDIKPSNIVIRKSDKKAVLVDFGLARPLEGVTSGKTAIGTVGYSPPEQYRGKQKIQSDIYSLGATLHHMITGKFPDIPFDFPPVRQLNSSASVPLEQVIMKALENEISNRFSTAFEMEMALTNVKNKKKSSFDYEKISKTVMAELPSFDQDLSKGHSNLGALYAKKGYYKQAKEEMEKAVQFDNSSAEALCNLGYIHMAIEEYDEALDKFKKSIKLKPDLSIAYSNLGSLYGRMGRTKDAICELRKAIRVNPSLAEAHINLANLYGKANRYREMIEECKKAIKIKPQSVEAYINLAYGCSKSGDYDEGIRRLEMVTRFASENEMIFSNLGVLYGEVKRYDKSVECLNKSIKLNPDFAEAYTNLGVVYYKNGNYNEAKECFKKSVKINPELLQGKINLAYFCREQKISDKERREIKELLNTEEEVILQSKMGYSSSLLESDERKTGESELLLFNNVEDKEEEKKVIQAGIEEDENNPANYIKLGNFYLENGRYDEAVKEYQKILRSNSSHLEARLGLAGAYEKKELFSLAEGEYKKIIKSFPGTFIAYLNLGTILFNKGDVQEGLNYFLKALGLEGTSSEIYFKIGLAYKKLGKVKQAIAAFESSIEKGYDKSDVYFNIGFLLYEQGDFHNETEEYFKKAIYRKPDYEEAYLYLGNLYYKNKLFSQAIASYREAIELKPDYAIAYSNLGAVYSDLDDCDEALINYFKALELNNNLAETHLNLGVLYKKKRDYVNSIKEMVTYLNLSDAKDIDKVREFINEMESVMTGGNIHY